MKSFSSHIKNLQDRHLEVYGDVLHFDPDSREWRLALFVYEMLAHEEDSKVASVEEYKVPKPIPQETAPMLDLANEIVSCIRCKKNLDISTDETVWLPDGPTCRKCT